MNILGWYYETKLVYGTYFFQGWDVIDLEWQKGCYHRQVIQQAKRYGVELQDDIESGRRVVPQAFREYYLGKHPALT
jgi:hypothetical protein